MNRIFFLNRGYAFKGLLAVSEKNIKFLTLATCLFQGLHIILI